jgi:protein-S-isoprenylcysteine O-methyltransferase Ste14
MHVKTRFILNAFIASFAFSLILFISAGRMDYLQGWIYFCTSVVTTSMNVLTIRDDDELMRERSRPGEGTKRWDAQILGASLLLSIAALVIAGLDSGRYGWSPQLHWSISAAGAFLMVAGLVVFLAARRENRFFSTVVRIQRERGHTVCTTGVYGIVRHPGYAGMIVSTLGLPLLLGSLWSAVPVFLSIVLLFVRTTLEDKTLMEELEGYKEYAGRIRYRLVPGIW